MATDAPKPPPVTNPAADPITDPERSADPITSPAADPITNPAGTPEPSTNPGQVVPAAPPAPGTRQAKPAAPPARKYREVKERGLHPVFQLVILAGAAAAASRTLAARRHDPSSSLVSLVATDSEPAVKPEVPDPAELSAPTGAVQPVAPAPPAPIPSAPAPPPTPAPAPVAPKPSTLMVESQPAARVLLDDKDRGRTPLTLRVSPGSHLLLVVGPGGQTRQVLVNVPAGGVVKKVVSF